MRLGVKGLSTAGLVLILVVFIVFMFVVAYTTFDKSLFSPKEPSLSPEDCNACYYNDKCIPHKFRLSVNDSAAYCDLDSSLRLQKAVNETCDDNFECKSNLCSDGECVGVKAAVEEISGLRLFMLKSICKIPNLFSNENYITCMVNEVKRIYPSNITDSESTIELCYDNDGEMSLNEQIKYQNSVFYYYDSCNYSNYAILENNTNFNSSIADSLTGCQFSIATLDYCVNETTIAEQICSNNSLSESMTRCTNSCNNGACT